MHATDMDPIELTPAMACIICTLIESAEGHIRLAGGVGASMVTRCVRQQLEYFGEADCLAHWKITA